MQIAIIVIGQNEAETLPDICNKFKLFSADMGGGAELIFVDSDSTDDSVAIVENFRKANPELNIAIKKIVGKVNAAKGRNAGIEFLGHNARYIFFLDGDIVFEPQFIQKAINVLQQDRKIGTVTGTIYDCYDTNASFLRGTDENRIVKHHGGNFICRKNIIPQIGRFDENLVKHQDIDYCFRIRAKGFLLKKINVPLGYHYTTHYTSMTRVCSDLKKFKYLSTGILFRKYIFTKFAKDLILSGSVKAVALRLFLILLLICSFFNRYSFLFWLGCMGLFLSRTEKTRGENYSSRIVSLLNGAQFVAGIFCPMQRGK